MSLKTSATHRRTANRFGGPILQSYDAKTATVSNLKLCEYDRNKDFIEKANLDRNKIRLVSAVFRP